jgi:hypothetical protein
MKALFIFGWMLLCSFSSAQVKIGGDPKIIHPHSLLELKSNTKALVLAVVTDLEMQAITPLNGALVFNIDQGCVFFYHQRWMPLCEFTPPTTPTPASFQNISENNFLFTSSSGEQTLIEVPSINHGHENTLTDAISHTHETENYALYNHSHATQNFALNTHTHDFPLTTTASHTHDYSNFASIDHSHNLSNTTDTTNPYQGLNPLDSLQLNQFRQGIKGSLWHTESNGLVGEIKNKSLSELAVFWDQDKQRLGIGTINPTNKLHVAGEIRSQGFSNSNGSQNEPSYSFKSDTNTGIFRAAADQLAFSTKGQEQMRLTKEGHLAIGISATNSFLEVNGALSLKITQSHTQTTTLNENYHTVILYEEVQTIVLPIASENKGRVYCLKNLSGHEVKTNFPFIGLSYSAIAEDVFPLGVTWIQSDGEHWQQIR